MKDIVFCYGNFTGRFMCNKSDISLTCLAIVYEYAEVALPK
jgi:hypothetical protein